MFYTYDAIAAFREPEGERKRPVEYVSFQALGRAIIEAYPHDQVAHLLPADAKRYQHPGAARRSVVLIDEIDKAPRDFPNDLLNEIDRLYFRIAEFDNMGTPGADGVEIQPTLRPIIVITSNSEKTLPDPFLRRCVFHHIPFPEELSQLREIVDARISDLKSSSPVIADALKLFRQFRGKDNGPALKKRPSTAELLDWLRLVLEIYDPQKHRNNHRDLFETTLNALVKQADDREAALKHLESKWS